MGHAVLSPSASERWISCPASVRVGQDIEARYGRDEGSSYAHEGTAAHALAELRARAEILQELSDESLAATMEDWRQEYNIDSFAEDEMMSHVDAYIKVLRERMELYPHTSLLLEQRVDPGLPSCWGTSDAVLISPVHVEIVDFKYGQGVAVSAFDNPQTKLYGVGALEMFDGLLGDIEIVRMTIHQPRLDYLSTQELSAKDLREWRDSLLPIAEEALGDNARFGPSEDACRWCPAKGQCRAQLEWATQRDFAKTADLLDVAEIADALVDIPMIMQWCQSVLDTALDLAYSKNTPIPGHKVVLSGGKRYVTDPDEALRLLEANGFLRSSVSKVALKGIGELEKLLGKDRFVEVLGSVVSKSTGKPALVPESDRRAAVSPNTEAAKDFSSEETSAD